MPLEKEFCNVDEMGHAQELLSELLDLDQGLTSWEIDFITSLDEWDGSFTYGQYVKLKEVHERHF